MSDSRCLFADRADAGRQLAPSLAAMTLDRPVAYALPRGGVPVGIVVDDGLATGATAKVALIAIKRQGATRVILAIPVAPEDETYPVGL